MFESSYPPETEADEVASGGTIGQALDRIVSDAPRAPVLNKKLVFPRESVRVSELEEKQRKAREEEEKQAKLAKEKEEKARMEAEKAAQAKKAAEFKDLDLPFEDEEVGEEAAVKELKPVPVVENVPERKVEAAIPKPVASPTTRTQAVSVPKSRPSPTQKQPVAVNAEGKSTVPNLTKSATVVTPVREEEVIPEREVVAYRRVIPARRRVMREISIPEKVEIGKNASVSEADLEFYMRETEKVELRQVVCRAATMQLIEEIAEQTGCAPEDLASQAIESVAMAIQQAGFKFDLPMAVKCVRERK